MRPFGIIEAVDVLKDGQVQFLKRVVMTSVDFFFLEILEKSFADGVVKRIAFLGKGLDDVQRIEKPAKGKGGILGAAVGMEDETVRSLAGCIGALESSHHEIGVGPGRDMPGNDLAGKEVDDDAEIIPFPGNANIRNIACPHEIRGFLAELLMQMIRAFPSLG